MDHFREINNHLTWHKDGKFEAILTNCVITHLSFCGPGKGEDASVDTLTSTNLKYLKQVHQSLEELFAFMKQEEAKMGYKYANPGEAPIEPALTIVTDDTSVGEKVLAGV